MTQGLQLIRTAFAGYEDSYVIIGGTACDIIMTDNELDFRATKDIDMVLIAEGTSSRVCTTIVVFHSRWRIHLYHEELRTASPVPFHAPQYVRVSHYDRAIFTSP